MRPLILGHSDLGDGAARAAFRLGQALVAEGVACEMRVDLKLSDAPWVLGQGNLRSRLRAAARARIGQAYGRLHRAADDAYRSFNVLPSRVARSLDAGDVVNLHWVGAETVRIEEIGRIARPIVWTLHDMWPFCGAEHYADDGPGARWRAGYKRRDGPAGARDADRRTWRRKKRSWKRPISIVCPSRWLAECASASALMAGWPVSVIPNPLDTEIFSPWPRALARRMLKLPPDRKLVTFGALAGTTDSRKGWDLLATALAMLRGDDPAPDVLIFGRCDPRGVPHLGLRVHATGPLTDEIALALVYSASDVVVVPSRQDNLPQTATEAQACGCPVVAFDTGGLRDALDHERTGYLARPFEPEDLAAGIRYVLADERRRMALSRAARDRAVALWNRRAVARQYLAAYEVASALDRRASER